MKNKGLYALKCAFIYKYVWKYVKMMTRKGVIWESRAIAMASKNKDSKKHRYPLELNDTNSKQLELLKKYSKYATTSKGVLVRALEDHFDQELIDNKNLRMEWEKLTKEKKTKILLFRKE